MQPLATLLRVCMYTYKVAFLPSTQSLLGPPTDGSPAAAVLVVHASYYLQVYRGVGCWQIIIRPLRSFARNKTRPTDYSLQSRDQGLNCSFSMTTKRSGNNCHKSELICRDEHKFFASSYFMGAWLAVTLPLLLRCILATIYYDGCSIVSVMCTEVDTRVHYAHAHPILPNNNNNNNSGSSSNT